MYLFKNVFYKFVGGCFFHMYAYILHACSVLVARKEGPLWPELLRIVNYNVGARDPTQILYKGSVLEY